MHPSELKHFSNMINHWFGSDRIGHAVKSVFNDGEDLKSVTLTIGKKTMTFDGDLHVIESETRLYPEITPQQEKVNV